MKLLQNRYRMLSKLGQGSYGTVYSARDILLGINVAVKVSKCASNFSQEVNIYSILNQDEAPIGVPKFYTHVVDANQEYFVMQLLGSSLRSLCHSRGDRFSFKTVAMLGIQMITRLESLHDRGVLHCDIKDDNFLMSSDTVCIVDFGMCKSFINPNTKDHVQEAIDPKNIGTVSFSSVHTHKRVRSARRDDMESLGYLFVRWLKGYLPWEKDSNRNRFSKDYRDAGVMKEALTPDMLCKGLPEEFRAYLDHVRNLKFEERPKYAHLRGVLNSLLTRMGESNDDIYDWMPQ